MSGWPTLTPMHCNLHWLSFQMSHQIDQLIECIVTLVATVHLLSGVSFHMSAQRSWIRACKVTLTAFVHLFSAVRFQMGFWDLFLVCFRAFCICVEYTLFLSEGSTRFSYTVRFSFHRTEPRSHLRNWSAPDVPIFGSYSRKCYNCQVSHCHIHCKAFIFITENLVVNNSLHTSLFRFNLLQSFS